jgi:hypothetical protein
MPYNRAAAAGREGGSLPAGTAVFRHHLVAQFADNNTRGSS